MYTFLLSHLHFFLCVHWILSTLSCLTLRRRGFWRESISSSLETSVVPNDLKDGYDSRRNQQVYSASPVKTVNKHSDSGELYHAK